MRSRAVALVLVSTFAAAVAGVLVLLAPDRLRYPDSYYYAEMGRQLARGEGFTSLQGYPYLFAWLADRGVSLEPPWPNVSRFPLITVVYALAFWLGGATVATAKVVGAGIFTATAAVTCLLGARLFGTAVGVVAALLFTANLTQVELGVSGLLETGAAFFLVTATLGLVVVLGSPGGRAPLGLGAVLGLAFLWRYDLLVLLPAAAAVLGLRLGRAGAGPVAWMIVGFTAAVGPWVARNLWHFGTPLAMLAIDRNLVLGPGRGDPYASTDTVDVIGLLTNAEFMREKAAALGWPLRHWRRLFGFHLAWLGPAVLAAGGVLRLRRHPALAAWTFVLVAWLLRAALLSLMHHEPRFYQSFTAVCLVLGVGAAAILLRFLPPAGRGVGALVAAGLCAYGASHVASWGLHLARAGPLPGEYLRMIRNVGARTKPGAIIATRRSAELVAWFGDRFVVSGDARGIVDFERRGVPVHAVLHQARDAAWVRKALDAQGLSDRYVPVPVGGGWTLWRRSDATPPPTRPGTPVHRPMRSP